jgi:hypothetical protein
MNQCELFDVIVRDSYKLNIVRVDCPSIVSEPLAWTYTKFDPLERLIVSCFPPKLAAV